MKSGSILIVDDELEVRETMAEYLDFEGYKIEQAENGLDALEILKNRNFELVITDFRMPKLNGKELVLAVRKLGLKMPIFLLTGYTDLTEQESLEIGVTRFLIKPLHPSDLLAAIHRIQI